MSEEGWAIGVDLGGTKIEVALVNEKGQVLERLRIDTDVKAGPIVVERQVIDAIQQLLPHEAKLIKGVGVGVAGQVEAQTGNVLFAPNLNWHFVPLKENLSRFLNLPVTIINDVRAATWGEWLYGAGQQCQNMVCLFIGTGIGGGVVANGEVLSGGSNTMGELGHMVIDFKGPPCTCGNRGCLEAIAGGWGVAKRAKDALREANSKDSILMKLVHKNIDAITAKDVSQAAQQGDSVARHIMQEMEQALIAGVISIVHAFNPDRIVIGGGFFEGIPSLIWHIDQSVKKNALKAATSHLQILPAKLHQDAGVIGAAALAIHTFAKGEVTSHGFRK